MKQKTIISLSFDDGREDTYRMAYKIMKKYNLVGTVHVTTGYIDGTWINNSWKSARGPMSIEQLKELLEYGFEISAHGDKHRTAKDDLLTCVNKMHEWGIISNKVGFSIPCSKLADSEKVEFVKYLKAFNIKYMRGGRNKQCYSFLSKVFYFFYNVTKSKLFYILFNRFNCIDINNYKVDQYNLPSVIIRYGDKAKTITEFIKTNKNNWIIFMLHSIQNKDEDTFGKDPWCWDAVEFEKLCSNLKELVDEGEVYVKSIMDVISTL